MSADPPQEPPVPPEPAGQPTEEPARRPSGALLALGALAGTLAVVGAVTLVVGGVCVALLTTIGR